MKRNLILILAAATALSGCNGSSAGDAWIAQIGGGGPELVYDLVETPDGRTCATGSFWATVTFGSDEKSRTLSTDGTQDIFVACYDQSGDLASVTQFGAHRGDDVRAIAAAPNGDVIITGVFARQFGAHKNPTLTAQSGADIFLARLNRSGDEVWARRLGGAQADTGTSLAVTADGHILLGGTFSGTMTFPIGDRLDKLNSAGDGDAFVMKLTGDGEPVWAHRIGGSKYDQVTAVGENPAGEIFAGGSFAGRLVADDGQPARETAGYNDVFVAAYSSDGMPRWLERFGGPQQDALTSLTADEAGVFVAGNFQGQFEARDINLASNGATDIFLMRLDRNGVVVRASSFGSLHTEQVFDLARADDGTLYLAGHFQGAVDFAPGDSEHIEQPPRPGDSNAFVLALAADGEFRSVRTTGGIGVEIAFAVATRASGGVTVAGVFNEEFDPAVAGTKPLPVRGKTDVFLLASGP